GQDGNRSGGIVDHLAHTFIVHEEEQLLLHQRTAQVSAKLVEAQWSRGRGEIVLRVHGVVAEEVKQVSVKGVAAGLGDHVDDVARGAAVLRGIGGREHPEFLNAFDAGTADARLLASELGADSIHVNPGGVSAIEEDVDTGKSRFKPAETVLSEAAGGDGTGNQCDERGKVAAIQREVGDLVRIDGSAGLAGLGVYGHRGCGDGNLLGSGADIQSDVGTAVVGGIEDDSRHDAGFESGMIDLHAVRAGRKAGYFVLSDASCLDLIEATGLGVGDFHVGPDHNGAALVAHHADDAAGIQLCAGGRSQDEEKAEKLRNPL